MKNNINKKVYIGQTILSLNERIGQHRKPSNSKYNYKLYRAIRKHEFTNFYFEILEDNIPMNQLDEKEIQYIELHNSFKGWI